MSLPQEDDETRVRLTSTHVLVKSSVIVNHDQTIKIRKTTEINYTTKK